MAVMSDVGALAGGARLAAGSSDATSAARSVAVERAQVELPDTATTSDKQQGATVRCPRESSVCTAWRR